MKEKSLIFYNKVTGKELLSYSISGSFEGEKDATIELLAYENNIDITDIEIKMG